MHLTGLASGPPSVSPAGVVRPLIGLGETLASATGRLGAELRVDPVGSVAHRAAFTGFGRSGSRSPGGFAQMVRARDGWVALNLPRPSDIDMLPALVGAPMATRDWPVIEQRLAAMTCNDIVDTGSLLGLAVASVGATGRPELPWAMGHQCRGRPRGSQPVVVDLSSLWAGPLAGGLLAEAGCRVLKVESTLRPDGARRGPAGFLELLNGRKEQLSLDLPTLGAIGRLRELIARADLVLEASRPRVMQQWGISAAEVVAAGTAWVSITGHGRSGRHANRVAFGDDAAASGGLAVPGDPPMFVGDAIADPIAGLAAAAAAADLLADGCAALVDVSLAGASAWVRAHAGAPIDRPVIHSDGCWRVELTGGPVPVRPPAVPDEVTACPVATK